eukprot:3699550-Prymnesium_polylepis.1
MDTWTAAAIAGAIRRRSLRCPARSIEVGADEKGRHQSMRFPKTAQTNKTFSLFLKLERATFKKPPLAGK